MITPDYVRNEIERLGHDLFQKELALDFRPSVIKTLEGNIKATTWVDCRPSTDLIFTTVDEYRWYVQNKQYSVLLFDGALLQISYKFKRRQVVEHRLCFYPCPFHLSTEERDIYQEMGYGLLDIFEDFNFNEYQSHLRLQSPIRFDFDSERATQDHPASHFHLSREHCRIPVFAPLRIGHFIQFVFENFYPEQWHDFSFLREWPSKKLHRTITPDQERLLHLNLI